MTAEVAVMNRSAIALAADSLVTVSRGSEPEKTYDVNKLFALSKHHPVGVMVYGNASFMSYPWETVIKEYRRTLKSRCFDQIDGYARDLLRFLGRSEITSHPDTQKRWFKNVIGGYFHLMVRDGIDATVKKEIDEKGERTRSQITRVTTGVIKKWLEELQKKGVRPYLPRGFGQRILRDYDKEINDEIDGAMEKRPVSVAARKALKQIAVEVICRDMKMPAESGLVVAGFGRKEAFPVVEAFSIYGAIGKNVICSRDTINCVEQGSAAVVPFAQRDAIDAFLIGIDDDDIDTIVKYMNNVFSRLPSIIATSADIDEAKKNQIETALLSATATALGDFQQSLHEYMRKHHIDPLLKVLQSLPKEELAELAESLVSLTSVKRKISPGMETVGGPVDVAIITKGDGLVWMKRKHYFDAELNHSFINRYLEE